MLDANVVRKEPECFGDFKEYDPGCIDCSFADRCSNEVVSYNETKKLWVERGSRSRLFCFVPCLLIPPIGYYFAAKGWRGVGVTILTNIFITMAGYMGGIITMLSVIVVFIFFWKDLGVIFKENDLY